MILRNLDNVDLNNVNFWNKLVHDVRNFLIQTPDKQNKILSITLKEIAYDNTSLIPKLEYKESEDSCIT